MLERKRETEQAGGGIEGERAVQVDLPLSTEPDPRLDLMTLRS